MPPAVDQRLFALCENLVLDDVCHKLVRASRRPNLDANLRVVPVLGRLHQAPVWRASQAHNPELLRAGGHGAIELPSRSIDVEVLLIAPFRGASELHLAGDGFVVGVAAEELIDQRLVLESGELDAQDGHSLPMQHRHKLGDQLGIVLDAVVFPNKHDVVIGELRRNVVLGRPVMRLEVGDKPFPKVWVQLGQRELLLSRRRSLLHGSQSDKRTHRSSGRDEHEEPN